MNDRRSRDLASPPRVVPWSVRLCILLGGGVSLAGWLVLLVGMVFVWIFGVRTDLPSRYLFRGELGTATAKVTRSRATAFTEGGSRRSRGARVYANEYAFSTPDGKQISGVSYARGAALKPGKEVTVEFPKDEPGLSRIKGMRRGMLSPWAALVFVFPVTGVVLVLVGLRKGAQACGLLADGEMGTGVLVSKEPTAARVNRRTVYRLTFQFDARDGQAYQVVSKTHMPERLEDEEQEQLLYDPLHPSYAVMFDSLPGSPTIDSRGQIEPVDPMKLGARLLLPALVVCGHGGYALFWFGR